MAESENRSSGSWLSLPNDSPKKTLIVALILCVVCSVAVAAASVLLKPLQERNKALATRTEILRVAGLLRPGEDVDKLFEQVETRIVELSSGRYAENIDAAEYDQRAAARDPERSVTIDPAADHARLNSRAKYAPVYVVRDAGRPVTLILPVHGAGLWSTMYAFLALAPDGRTIKAAAFYEQGETPGLGAEVASPRWLASWRGKVAIANDGTVQFRVKRGRVDPRSAEATYAVDGLTGASLTSDGVTNLMRYWLGKDGFGPYLARVRAEKLR